MLAAAPAGATPLPPTPNPLPGSSFQGADGDQDDAFPRIDWQALQGAGVVRHSPDPNAQDDAFKGGSQEDEPGGWDFDVEPGGVNPGQDNIRDAWSAVRPPDGEWKYAITRRPPCINTSPAVSSTAAFVDSSSSSTPR